MPSIQLGEVSIYYETFGQGPPLLLLHAGWGTPVNGFEGQVAALGDRFKLIIPHRHGYGRSSRVQVLGPDYHREAVPHMLAVLDHAGVESAFLWGHSDGAVVGAWMAILAPERVRSLVFEGGHRRARKEEKQSQLMMLRVRERPETLPDEIKEALAAGHGADYWKRLLWLWTDAWHILYSREGDLYDGRLGEIRCPTLVVHGGRDPHTPISEVAELAAQVQDGRTLFFPEGGHSLHDDPTWMETVHAAVLDLFSSAEAKASRTTPSEATGA
jgi:pimeloyl-ACP methyl ester carboxylesterase